VTGALTTTVTAISEYDPRASVTRIVEVNVPVADDDPTCRNPPVEVIPVKVMFEFVGEFVTVIVKVPVPPLML
jgi:hypothetical protein